MKKTFYAIPALAILIAIKTVCCSPNPDSGAGTTVGVTAPSVWFTGDTTAPPSDIVPFDQPNTNDTSFHLWSWQKFLSLTRSANSKAPFESWVQVDNFLNLVGDTIFLSDSSQAGTHGVLYDKNNRAILYTVHLNQQMYDFQMVNLQKFRVIFDKYKDSTNRDALVQQAIVAEHLDTLNYPVGAVELKTSWILASSVPNIEDYYVTNAIVSAPSGKSVQSVALLGMHIVGRVANHPEFIWATYEHEGLAPDYGWTPPGYPDPTTVVSNQDFLFYKAGTTIGDCPMNNGPDSAAVFTNLFNLYTLGLQRGFTTDSVSATSVKDSTNNANMVSLNASVYSQLQNVTGPWGHYFYKGSVWLSVPNTSFKPGQGYLGNLTNSFLRGSRALSNITMESFAQLQFSGVYTSGSMNCFGCHATADYTNVTVNTDSLSYNLALSHLFKNALGVQVPDVSGPDSCRNCDVIPRKR